MSFPSEPSIQIAVRGRDAGHGKLNHLQRAKLLLGNEGADVARQSAPVGDKLFERVEAALPALHVRVPAQPMLEEKKNAARLEHAMDFRKSVLNALYAAQRERADDAIEHSVRKRKALAALHVMIDVDSPTAHATPCERVHAGVGIDRGYPAHLGRVARQVEAGSQADFQNISLDVRQQFAAQLGDERLTQDEVAKPRKEPS